MPKGEHSDIRVSRAATLAAVATWLEGSERTFWIEGPPGSGKSVIAALVSDAYPSLDERAPLVVLHACKSSDIASIAPRSFVEKVVTALAAWQPFARSLLASARGRETNISVIQNVGNADKVTGVSIERVVIGDVSPEDAFVLAVLDPLKRALAEHPRTVLLVVDGLDESILRNGGSGIGRLISALDGAPSGLRLLVTSRPDSALRGYFDEEKVWRLDDGPARATVRDELLAFVQAACSASPDLVARIEPDLGTEGLAALVADRAVDNFLVARLLLDMLAAEEGLIRSKAARTAPATLHGIYRLNLLRIRQRLGDQFWAAQRLPILSCLAVAFEPLSERALAAISGIAPDLIRAALVDLRQFLSADWGVAPSRRRFAIYHRSFTEFLLDSDAAVEDWCSEPDQHRRIMSAVRGKSGWGAVRWDSAEPYVMRYAAAHAAEQGAGALDDLIGLVSGAFLHAQHDRAGPASTLESLRIAIRVAADDANLGHLYRFAWLYAALRDLLTQRVSPAMVQLYARLGEVDRALRLIDDIEDPYKSARIALVQSLARAGRIEEARRVSKLDNGELAREEAWEMSMALAQAVVEIDPPLALALAPRPGIGFLWWREIALCAGLARRDEFVDAALQRAEYCDEAVVPLALEVAKRDWQRGLSLMNQVHGYKERIDRVTFYRDRNSGIAELAIQLSRDGKPQIAIQLLAGLRPADASVAASVMAGELSTGDIENSKSCLDILQQTHRAPQLYLAAAHVIALDTCGAGTFAERLLSRASRLRKFGLFVGEFDTGPLDLLRRVDLTAIGRNKKARGLALIALRDLAVHLSKEELRSGENYYGHLGFHWGALDPDGAATFALNLQHPDRRMEFRAGVVAGAAVRDFDWAVTFAKASDLDYEARAIIFRSLARKDLSLALRFLDLFFGAPGQHKVDLLATIASEFETADAAELRQLLDRISRYVDTVQFRAQVRDARVAVARHLLSDDVERGRSIARAALAENDPDDLILFEIEARKTDPLALPGLVRGLRDPLNRARHLLDLAIGNLSLLPEAHETLDSVPVALVERDAQVARLFDLYQRYKPLEALKLAIAEEYDSETLSGPVRAFLEHDDGLPLLFKAKAIFQHLPEISESASFHDWAGRYRRQKRLIEAVLRCLDGTSQQELINLLEQHGEDRRILEWQCALRQDPRRVILQVSEALRGMEEGDYKSRDPEFETIGLRALLNRAIKEVALEDPQYAVSVWRQVPNERDQKLDVLATIVAAAARCDIAAADALAREGGENADEVRRVAVTYLADDANLSLQLMVKIAEPRWRGYALEELAEKSAKKRTCSEPIMRQMLDLAPHVPPEEKARVIYSIARELAGKSITLQAYALHVAALAERRVFPSTIAPFAALVVETINPDSMLAMTESVRDVLEPF